MKIAREFRSSAWSSLKGRRGVAVGAGLIASLLGGAGTASGSTVSFNFETEAEGEITDINELINTVGLEGILPVFWSVFAAAIAFFVVGLVLGSVISIGYSRFNLDLIDGKAPTVGSLFNYFGRWGTAVCANLLTTVYVFVGFILFIIPGILAVYNYSMVPYILAEDENLTATEALDRSKSIMYGNRWRFFCLELSFIGWDLLTILTFGILSLWTTPYKAAAYADFYREITDSRPSETDEQQPDSEQKYDYPSDIYTDL